jgi:hypothetical protein
MKPTAEIERLLAEGKLERIGMGSRRACYRLPDGKHCLKCYRSDAEVAEGKHPGLTPPKPLAVGAVREIQRCRFDERRNTCCQEYRYWLKLGDRLPPDLMQAFPASIEMVRLPSRGWALMEELVENADGTPPRKFAEEWRASGPDRRRQLFSAFNALAKDLERHAVRFYDPQNILVQNLKNGSFSLRITDFEPASRLLVPIDVLPFVSGLKVRRRFEKYRVQNGIRMPIDNMGGSEDVAKKKVNVLCLKWGAYYGPEYVNRLYAGVKRNLRRPFRFVCVTDNPEGLADGVDAVPFPPPPQGWKGPWPNIFVKLCVFQDGFAGLKGPTLFLDVDQVVTGPLDRFFDYKPGEFCIIHNWIEWRKHLFRRRPMIGNSSCFRFEAGGMNHVYEKFLAEQDRALNRRLFRTEQAFMTYAVGLDNINWWPNGWVASFKRSCAWMFPLNLVLRPRHPPKAAGILCFHGNPSPEEAIAGFRGKKGHIEQRTLPAPWIEALWTGESRGGHPLPVRLRRKWDCIMASEGARLGLSECRAFLENKTVNDIFYEGLFKGLPCIVKCSSRAPDSIANEYEMLRRVHAAEPSVFPEPFALWTAPDGRMAFVAMEKVGGGTPSDPAADILRIAETLHETGIIHRDVSKANLLCGQDGHLKLIDFQFAVDRRAYHESRFMRRNPKYLYVHFGNCEELGLGRWNDVLRLMKCLHTLAPQAEDAQACLRTLATRMTFSAPVPPTVRFRLNAYRASLAIQRLFVRKPATAWRNYKLERLLSV